MFKFQHPFKSPTKEHMLKVSLAKATEELHEAKLHAEAWHHTLALHTARVARLESELAGSVPPLPKVKAAPTAVAFETLTFPPMDVPLAKVKVAK